MLEKIKKIDIKKIVIFLIALITFLVGVVGLFRKPEIIMEEDTQSETIERAERLDEAVDNLIDNINEATNE